MQGGHGTLSRGRIHSPLQSQEHRAGHWVCVGVWPLGGSGCVCGCGHCVGVATGCVVWVWPLGVCVGVATGWVCRYRCGHWVGVKVWVLVGV